MKFAISLLIMSSTAMSSPIRIFYEGDLLEAEVIRTELLIEYQIPDELMNVFKIENCGDVVAGGKLDLCLKNNGDLEVVSVDRRFINESLKIFRAH